MTIEKAFGIVIYNQRRGRGISKAKLAKLANISAGSLAQIEQGKAGPRLRTLYALATALQIPVDALMWRTTKVYREVQ